MNADFPIDFVIPWVDGSDPEWIKVFNNYVPKEKQIDARNIRYRDFGLLKYWFRAVEKFTPWVNKVHFITCGQKPDFLNLNCLKLHFVKHSDYIPDDCLPAFSSRPIELNIHRINGLSDHFVYFNDDFYITKPLKRDFFFKDGLPCDSAVLEVKTSGSFPMVNIVFNDLNAINKNFKPKESVKNNPCKWFNAKYGKANVYNIFLTRLPKFCGFINPHMPQPFLKSTLEDVWAKCPEELNTAIHNKFRSPFDVNQWLFRHWALCKGDFSPINPYKDRRCFDLYDGNAELIAECIRNQKYAEVVLNDSEDLQDFEKVSCILKDAFEAILPEKSSFEL